MKKVLLINGSPHKAGCTFTALEQGEFDAADLAANLFLQDIC